MHSSHSRRWRFDNPACGVCYSFARVRLQGRQVAVVGVAACQCKCSAQQHVSVLRQLLLLSTTPFTLHPEQPFYPTHLHSSTCSCFCGSCFSTSRFRRRSRNGRSTPCRRSTMPRLTCSKGDPGWRFIKISADLRSWPAHPCWLVSPPVCIPFTIPPQRCPGLRQPLYSPRAHPLRALRHRAPQPQTSATKAPARKLRVDDRGARAPPASPPPSRTWGC